MHCHSCSGRTHCYWEFERMGFRRSCSDQKHYCREFGQRDYYLVPGQIHYYFVFVQTGSCLVSGQMHCFLVSGQMHCYFVFVQTGSCLVSVRMHCYLVPGQMGSCLVFDQMHYCFVIDQMDCYLASGQMHCYFAPVQMRCFLVPVQMPQMIRFGQMLGHQMHFLPDSHFQRRLDSYYQKHRWSAQYYCSQN